MSEKFQFEKALAELEKIVEALEAGELSLDEALKQYEEGVKLTRACQAKLQEAEKKIEILTRGLAGELKAEPFDPETFEETASSKKRASSKKKTADEDDLI
ncbi:MAG TPA: exodeoxyribonuclease VII small subunit [Candidatus Omnitrophica bacterium]|nr:exodeoxyribonuclease VII small subunit [Candidatus Omnitrophota bacterium]